MIIMNVTRQAMIDTLQAALAPLPEALAAWEGGSAAFGADDAMSDVDLAVIARADGIEAVFAAAEAALERLAPIALRYHVPEPTWHGFSQRFYLLRGASPFHLIDLSVQREDASDHFLAPERHGQAKVWFDRGAHTQAPAPDEAGRDARLRARVPVLASWFELTQPIVEKEALRGRPLDALNFYQGLTLRPLVELLRIVHCPWRHDFGLRYLQRDLPAEVHARLEPLAFVRDLEDLKAKHRQASAWFREVRASL